MLEFIYALYYNKNIGEVTCFAPLPQLNAEREYYSNYTAYTSGKG